MRYLDIGEEVFLFASSQFVVRRGVWTVDSWTSYSNRLGGRAAQGAHLTHWNAPAGISDESRECTPDVLIGRGFFVRDAPAFLKQGGNFPTAGSLAIVGMA